MQTQGRRAAVWGWHSGRRQGQGLTMQRRPGWLSGVSHTQGGGPRGIHVRAGLPGDRAPCTPVRTRRGTEGNAREETGIWGLACQAGGFGHFYNSRAGPGHLSVNILTHTSPGHGWVSGDTPAPVVTGGWHSSRLCPPAQHMDGPHRGRWSVKMKEDCSRDGRPRKPGRGGVLPASVLPPTPAQHSSSGVSSSAGH